MQAICKSAKCVGKPQESHSISTLNYPSITITITITITIAIAIASSGMATGGRMLHHLKSYTLDTRNHIIFPGSQVSGSRGRETARRVSRNKNSRPVR